MQNVLKREYMCLEGSRVILFVFFPTKSYGLEHSESIDMHIEKLFFKNLIFVGVRKFFFPLRRGQKVTDMYETISFLRLP